jgi:selenocysteine-specific elongation factor
MKSIIVGTAGHIDHGKTALVRALTGIDADRLPEEKRRGITIDIGFADLDLGDVQIGFVDVPGHERFVKNMLAGAHGIDLVALIVAADESVMPQTREHFDICRLLGVKQGLVVITKKDMVDEELLQLVQAETADLVAGSFLARAPMVAVSSRTGENIEVLKTTLHRLGLQVPNRSSEFVTRLPIDRAFTMRGFGTVVTGTMIAGEINDGEELELLPTGTRVRVRGLQVHGSAVKKAFAGQRTAVNLGGIEAAAVQRGMILAPVNCLRPTQIIDAEIQLLDSYPRALRSRQRVRVHIGAAEVLARVTVLQAKGEIKPGEIGFAQLRLESPIVAVLHDRFILRSYSPQSTIGGGLVLDAAAAKHRARELAQVGAHLENLRHGERRQQLAEFVKAAESHGLRFSDVRALTGWRDEVIDTAVKQALTDKSIVVAEGVLVGEEVFGALKRLVRSEVAAYHQLEPLSRGLAKEVLRERYFSHSPPELLRALLASLESEGEVIADKDIIRLREHTRELSDTDKTAREKLEQIYRDAGLEPPALSEAFAQSGLNGVLPRGRNILQLLIDTGALVKVHGDMMFHRTAIDALTARLRDYASQKSNRAIDVPTFKEVAKVSRKYAIPLLEYYDRQRVTRREGDRRIVL